MLKEFAIVLFALTLLSTTVQCSFAQKEQKRKQSKQTSSQLSKNSNNEFPGVGSYDNWQASRPEAQAGQALMKEQKWDQAIAHFRASLALYEFQPHAWLAIGRASEAKGGLVADAENAYRQSLKLDSQSAAAWHRLANVLYEQKRYAEAREAISNALNLNPSAKARAEMDKVVIRIDSALHNADTTGQNQSQ